MEIILSTMLRFIVLLVATFSVVIGYPRAGHHNARSRSITPQQSCRTDVYRKDSQNSCVKVYEIFPIEIKVLKDNEELDRREIQHLIEREISSLQRLLKEFDPMPYSHSLVDDLIGLCCSYRIPKPSSEYAQNYDATGSVDYQDASENEEDESEPYNTAKNIANDATVKQIELLSENSTNTSTEKLSFELETTVEEVKLTTQSDSDAADTQTQETTSQPTENPWTTILEPVKTHGPLTTQVDDALDSLTDESQYAVDAQDPFEPVATSSRPKKHKHPQATQADDMDTTRHTVPWFFPDSDSQYGDEVFSKINQKGYDRTYSNPRKHHDTKHQSQRNSKKQKDAKRQGKAKKHRDH